MSEVVRNAAVSIIMCLSATAESLKNRLRSHTQHLTHVCAGASRGVTLHQPNVQNLRCFSEQRRWDGAPRPPRAYFTIASTFQTSASALLCNELCFTLGQSSAEWCARLEKAQLKNVRLML